MNEGWICPKCKRANAPWRATCDCVAAQPVYPTRPYWPDYYPDWTYRPRPWWPYEPYFWNVTTISTTALKDTITIQ